jgi:hypothetical protein
LSTAARLHTSLKVEGAFGIIALKVPVIQELIV